MSGTGLRAMLRSIGHDAGYVCEVCGCWNPSGVVCKYGGDEAHRDPEEEAS